MKAEELMIGDWVICNHYQDKPFYHQFGLGDFMKGDYVFCEPIPLTPEVLEKNGFVFHHSDCAYFATVEKQMASDGIETSYISVFSRNILEIKTSVSELKMQCEYVHQLQHALRLCGIEKSIVV